MRGSRCAHPRSGSDPVTWSAISKCVSWKALVTALKGGRGDPVFLLGVEDHRPSAPASHSPGLSVPDSGSGSGSGFLLTHTQEGSGDTTPRDLAWFPGSRLRRWPRSGRGGHLESGPVKCFLSLLTKVSLKSEWHSSKKHMKNLTESPADEAFGTVWFRKLESSSQLHRVHGPRNSMESG